MEESERIKYFKYKEIPDEYLKDFKKNAGDAAFNLVKNFGFRAWYNVNTKEWGFVLDDSEQDRYTKKGSYFVPEYVKKGK